MAGVKIEREWGHYDILVCGDNYKLKRMFILPGGKIRRQMHMLRDEIWILVKGEIHACVNGSENRYVPGDIVKVKKMVEHMLENVGDEVAEIFEVQFGGCRETDVVYLEERPEIKEGPF